MTTTIIDYEAGGQDGRGVLTERAFPAAGETKGDKNGFKTEVRLADEKRDIYGMDDAGDGDGDGRLPTDEERGTLRLVAAKIPWSAYVICLCEFAERASYYGCQGTFNNFVQRPMPTGSVAGNVRDPEDVPGALGLGLQSASAITKTFQFLSYTLPILGGVMADSKWGKYKTVVFGTAIGFFAHVLLTISAIPALLATEHAVIPFVISIIILAFATGLIKSCIAPLIGDQSPVKRQSILTLPSGERVIVDPGVTIQSMLIVYYFSVNVGALFNIPTTYAEHDVGFWLAWLTPGILYMLMPITLWWCYRRIVMVPPQGTVIVDAVRVCKTVLAGPGLKQLAKRDSEGFWNKAKPSVTAANGEHVKDSVTWDDDFVDEMKRTMVACRLFLFLPVYQLSATGLDTIINSMGGAMTKEGVPNDLLSNFNSITLITVLPLMNYVVYPFLRKKNINFSPIRRIVFGYGICVTSMVVCSVLQYRVYATSPCGWYASSCDVGTGVSPISIWYQVIIYVLTALGEIFINITSYEIAYTQAPQRMKGLVFALVLFMSALSSAVALIITPTFKDPDLIWPFVGVGIANLVCMVLIWVFFRKMDDGGGAAVATVGADRPIEGIVRPDDHKDGGLQVKA